MDRAFHQNHPLSSTLPPDKDDNPVQDQSAEWVKHLSSAPSTIANGVEAYEEGMKNKSKEQMKDTVF